MDDPKLYHEAHELQRQDAEDIIEEFAPQIQWRTDGLDALIDVGSGPGDVLMDFIYPIMPRNFKRIVCSDIKRSMVEYARSNYQHLEKTEFRVLNMDDGNLPSDLRGQFDHVTSFYCFQILQDQRQGFLNVYNLLRPEGGDCFINTAPYVALFDGYTILSKNPKWSPYMEDVDIFTSRYQDVKDPRQDVIDILEGIGFCDYIVETRDRDHVYTLEAYKRNMKAISPYIHRLPVSLQDEFIEDFIEAMVSSDLNYQFLNRSKNTFRMPYKPMFIYAKKPCSAC